MKVSERSAKAQENAADIPAPTERAPTSGRFSVPFDEATGTIDFASMRPGSIDKLRRALTDPKASIALGKVESVENAKNDGSDVSALVVNLLYDAIGSIAVIGAKTRGYSEARAEMLRYTEQEKQTLYAPTLKVLNKYDVLGGKYVDEFTLLIAVGSITAAHVVALNAPVPSPALRAVEEA